MGKEEYNYRDFIENIKSYFQKIQKVTNGIVEIIQPQIEAINNIGKSLQPAINNFTQWIQKNSQIFEQLDNFFKKTLEVYNLSKERSISLLKKYKWFISPNLPPSIMVDILRIDNEKTNRVKKINLLFIRIFSDNKWINLEDMIKIWSNNPFFKKRIKIFEDCLYILKESYTKKVNITNVLLPTLISQIDGIWLDYLISKGMNLNATYSGRKIFHSNLNSVVLNSEFDSLANDIFFEILFQHSIYGIPLANPFNFNRHKILHGEYYNYGKKVYLIRAFLILDFLSGLE